MSVNMKQKDLLSEHEVSFVKSEIEKVKKNILEGKEIEKSLELYNNLVIHCHENWRDIRAHQLKSDLEGFLINQIVESRG